MTSPRVPSLIRAALTLVAATTVALALSSPVQASGTLDQSQTLDGGVAEGIWSSPFPQWVAQTFTAGITGGLSQVDLKLSDGGNPGDLTVQIESVAGGVASGSVLATVTVPQSSIVDVWTSVPLAPFFVPVVAGTQYAIVVSAASASLLTGDFYGWMFDIGDPYPQGTLLISHDNGASWLGQFDGGDTAFKTYVAVNDTTPPILVLPPAVSVDATGPAGAAVSYTVTATDDVDPTPNVVCAPPSGSVFPIGQTTVNCTATDASGNSSSGSFTVTVKGASEQLADLATAVNGVGPGKSLAAKVAVAQWFLAHDQIQAACLTLTAFNLEVKAQSGKKISMPQATALIADANRIRAVLDC